MHRAIVAICLVLAAALAGCGMKLPQQSPSAPAQPTSTPAVGSNPIHCGVDLNARAVQSAISSMELSEHHPLSIALGNFDPCATVSVVIVYPEGAAGSAVNWALMFHNGDYVGPATPTGYAYMDLNEG